MICAVMVISIVIILIIMLILQLETVYKSGFHKYIKENFTKIFDARPLPPNNVTNFDVPLLTIDKFGELSLEMNLILLDVSKMKC